MVVAAAGNAGNYPLHVQHQLTNDSTFTWFRPSGANPVYIEFWADTADLNNVEFRLAADKTTPTYEERGLLSWTNITPQLRTAEKRYHLEAANGKPTSCITKHTDS
jgi:hypothetical protein